jgi:hypothetical protein
LDEIDDPVRRLANGFLIGIPVVITVVSWWFGVQNERLDSLTLLAALYVLMLATRNGIGFRRALPREWHRLGDAMESLQFLWSGVRTMCHSEQARNLIVPRAYTPA